MFQDIENQIDNFSDLREAEQKDIYAIIQKRAATDKPVFRTYVSGLEYGYDSPRHIIYEALHKKPKGWDDFFFEELQRFILEAENGDEGAINDLMGLYHLCNPEGMSTEFYTKIFNFLSEHLDSSQPKVRLHCMEEIIEVNENLGSKYSIEQIQKLQKLLTDADFEVRMNAYSYLKDEGILSKGFQVSFLDKWRAKLTGKGYLLK